MSPISSWFLVLSIDASPVSSSSSASVSASVAASVVVSASVAASVAAVVSAAVVVSAAFPEHPASRDAVRAAHIMLPNNFFLIVSS